MTKDLKYFYTKFKELKKLQASQSMPQDFSAGQLLDEYIKSFEENTILCSEDIIKKIIAETSDIVGDIFLKKIIKSFCNELLADYAFVGVLSENKERIETLAFYHQGNEVPNFNYQLAGAPCEEVIGKTVKTYVSDVSKLFPHEIGLVRMNIEGYCGVPLFNSKSEPLGIVVVLYCKPIKNPKLVESIVQLMSVRIGAEIDRIEIEKTLRESERKYQHIADAISDYLVKTIIEKGKVVKTIYGNTCINVTGYSKEEYESDSYLWFNMIYDDDRKNVTDRISAIISGLQTKAFEHRIYHRNGSVRWVRNNPVLYYDNNNKLIEYDAIISDITELKQVELKMIENEKQYKLLFNEMNSGCALFEMIYNNYNEPVDYRYVETNPAYERLTRLKKEDLIGKTARELIPNIENKWVERFGRVAKSGVPEMFEDYIREDDRYYEVITYSPRKDYCAIILNEVSDRVKALSALIESESRYRTLVELLPDAVVVYTDNKIIYVNKQGCKMAGAKNANELIGMDIMRFIHSDYQTLILERNQKALRMGEFKSVNQEKLLKIDGTIVDIEANAAIIQYNNKPSVMAILRDISEKKKSEIALRRSEERFAMAMGAVNDGVFDWNLEKNDIYFSPKNYTMLGYDPYEFEASHAYWDSMIHPEDKENNYQQFTKHLKGELPAYEIEYRIRTKQGAYKWILERGKIFEKDSKNKPVRVIGIHTDIDLRKKIEENLRKEKDFIGGLMQINPVGIITTNAELDINFANDQAMQMMGIKLGDNNKLAIPRWSVSDLDGKKLDIRELPMIKANKTPITLYDQRYQLVWNGSKRICVSVNMHPIFNEFGIYDGTIFTITDITAQVDSEKQLRKAKENAEESDRLKSAFLANMSHEIRTPMNGIIGFSGLLSKDDLPSEKRQKYIRIIQNSTNQLLTIITDILDISKIEAGQLNLVESSFNLNSLLDETLLQFEKDKKDKGRDNIVLYLRKGLPDEDAEIYADKARLNQIVFNLLGNALKFTEQGTVEFGYTFNGSGVLEFYVKDTGIGISPQMQKIIFERFRQADDSNSRKFGGTGLGLAICRGLVELLKGKIWVDSTPDIGSVFFFNIPYIKMLPVGNQKTLLHPAKEEAADWQNTKILVVEDVLDNFLLLREIIDETKAQVIHASDGTSGIEMVKSIPDITLVLMDIQLPDINGYEATKAIKLLKPKLPVIAQTAFGLSGDREKALEAGCDEYISKPIIKSEFTAIVNRFITKKAKVKH